MERGFTRAAVALALLGIFVAVGLAAYHRYLRKVRIAVVGYREGVTAVPLGRSDWLRNLGKQKAANLP